MITCGGLDCSVCSILELVQNILNWLLGISGATAVLMVIIAGAVYLFSLGNTEYLSRAKRFLFYSIVGFIIVLVSFLAFNTAYLVLGASNKKSWFKIDCTQDSAGPTEDQNISAPDWTFQTNNPELTVLSGNSAQISVADAQKVTKMDPTNLDPNNMLLDSIELAPNQELKLITTGNTRDSDYIINYISTNQGFLSQPSQSDNGNRMAGTDTAEEVLSIEKDDQGVITATNNDQAITVDTANKEDMSKFQTLLEETVNKLKDENKTVYAYSNAGQEEYSSGDQDSCETGEGFWTVFQNRCVSRKAVCGQTNVKCADLQNEVHGCQCPEGSCLQYGRCVPVPDAGSSESNADTDKDGVLDFSDHCPDTPTGEKVDKSSTSSQKGCSCSQIPLESKKCPASRCEGSNLVNYPSSVQDQCLNGKIIKNSCNPAGSKFNQQCQQMQNTDPLNDKWKIANTNTNTSRSIQNWQNALNNLINGRSTSGSSIAPKPNDSINNWENLSQDEGTGGSAGRSGYSNTSSSNSSSSSSSQGEQSNSSQSNSDTSSSSSGTYTGGSEEARALSQKLEKVPEGILANNSGVTPYVVPECMPKLTNAAAKLNQIHPGWKIYPMSVFRSDQKQTQMWDRSSKNEKWIARPIARGGRGSGHTFGNALDIKFVDNNGRKVSMDDSNKGLLRQIMKDAGMIPYDVEWWHFYCMKPYQPQEHRPR